jgi:hypothetical protein
VLKPVGDRPAGHPKLASDPRRRHSDLVELKRRGTGLRWMHVTTMMSWLAAAAIAGRCRISAN